MYTFSTHTPIPVAKDLQSNLITTTPISSHPASVMRKLLFLLLFFLVSGGSPDIWEGGVSGKAELTSVVTVVSQLHILNSWCC